MRQTTATVSSVSGSSSSAGRQLAERDVDGVGGVAGSPLVGLADVDDDGVVGQLGHGRRGDRAHATHPDTADAPCHAMGRRLALRAREDPVDPVPRRLRPRRQLGRGLPAAAARARGLPRAHGDLLQPHRLRLDPRPAHRAGRRRRGHRRRRGARRLPGASTPCSPATRAPRRSARSCSTRSRGSRRPTPPRSTAATRSWATSGAASSSGEGIPEYMRDHVVPQADIVTPEPVRARVPRRARGRPRRPTSSRRRESCVAQGPDGRARHERADLRHPRGLDPDGLRHRRRTPGW